MSIKNKEVLNLAQQRPLPKKTYFMSRHSGRNNQGRLTVRHQGGGVKQLYRNINWTRKFFINNEKNYVNTDILETSLIVNFEYDPNRSVNLAKVASIVDFVRDPLQLKTKSYLEQVSFSYILAVKGMRLFDKIQNIKKGQHNIFFRTGDSSVLENFEPGDFVNCVESFPGQGALFARSAGTFCQVLQSGLLNYIKLKLPSGNQRLFSPLVNATLGVLSNSSYNQRILVKAGRNRWLNKRPTVRGVAMNPVDHPHGGGQGKTKGGRPSVTPNSRITKGFLTRNPRKKNKFLFSKVKKRIKKSLNI